MEPKIPLNASFHTSGIVSGECVAIIANDMSTGVPERGDDQRD